MKIIRTIRTVLQALQRNLMRAMLTTQGVVIGVAAVIARWKSAKDRPRLSKSPLPVWAPTTFSFIQEPQIVEAISFGAGSGMNLLPQDYEAIVRECPSVRSAAPVVRARAQLVYGNRNLSPSTYNVIIGSARLDQPGRGRCLQRPGRPERQ